MKTWFVSVVYHSEQGDVDVDFMVDDLKEVKTALDQGPGVRAIKTIKVEPMSPEIMTIQELAGELKDQHK